MGLWGILISFLYFQVYNKYFKISIYYPDSWGGNEHYPFSPKESRAGYGVGMRQAEVSMWENRKVQGLSGGKRKLKLGESYLQVAEAEGTCWRQAAQKIPRELLGTGLLSLVTSTSRARLHENLLDQRCPSQAPPSFFLPFIKYLPLWVLC